MSRIQLPHKLAESLTRKEPLLWVNPRWQPIAEARLSLGVSLADVEDASHRLDRFAALLEQLFPELEAAEGIIESDLFSVSRFQASARPPQKLGGRWFVKGDHNLPIAGSIKARGGFYEVLVHAEEIARSSGLITEGDRLSRLASPEARALFTQHEIAVGSTGNLGLSIGVIAAALGFQATVHMSQEAKEWKKARLRARGVKVIEHTGDFGVAVAAGRNGARESPSTYFVDDENSRALFLGYSVAAQHLQPQLAGAGVRVDAGHPLFVYLPCGVGGAPGGITLGLRHLFGDHVHAFFAEPVASPAMLLRLAMQEDRAVSVRMLGLDNRTEADGLAVAQASEFAAPLMRPLVSGIFTVPDEDLFEDLYLLDITEGIKLELSAAAGFRGPKWLLESPAGLEYLDQHGLLKVMDEATHLFWTTGGALVPPDEYSALLARGEEIVRCRGA